MSVSTYRHPGYQTTRSSVTHFKKVSIGDVVNILRPDMVSRKGLPYKSMSRPHIVVELKGNGSFIGIPFSTTCDCFGEQVMDEVFPEGVGRRTEDGWICPNRTKLFTIDDLNETEEKTFLRWKQGHIKPSSYHFDLVIRITKRWNNFKVQHPGVHFGRTDKNYPIVHRSSFLHFD